MIDRSTLDWFSSHEAHFLQCWTRWCQTNSGSHHLAGLEQMAAELERDFAGLGATAERVALPASAGVDDAGKTIRLTTGDALVWRLRPELQRRVLLVIHYDTVYPPTSPGVVRIEGKRLIAPGAADAKGGIAVILAAMTAMVDLHLAPSVGCTIVLNPDEEIGSPCSREFLQSLVAAHDFGLLFEPTLPDGSWVGNRKGSGNWTAVITGQSAHAGRNPAAGRNAVVHACRLADTLDRLNDHQAGRTINVGSISGGGPLNRVPDLAILRWNVRTAARQDQLSLVETFRGLAGKMSSDGFQCRLSGAFHAPVKQSDAAAIKLQSALQRAAAGAGRSIRWRDTGGACDGNHLAAAGLPNVDTLGVTGDHLHHPAEFAELDSLVPAASTVVAAMCDFDQHPTRWPLRK